MSSLNRKLLLVGCNGMLARAIASAAPAEYLLTGVDLPEFDITERSQVISLCERLRPEIIINCAAYTDVDGCETEVELANRVNGTAVGYLAEVAKCMDATLFHISTDYLFDGRKGAPYSEEDQVNPQSAYGRSKLLGEQAILTSGLQKYFIVRTSWLYGPGGKNFVETILRLAGERETLKIVEDQFGSPTYTGDLAEAIFNLLTINASPQSPVPAFYGIYHFSNEGHCSWYEFACAIVAEARSHNLPVVTRNIHPIRTEEYPLPAKRPAYSVFDNSKYKAATGAGIPDWRDSLKTYLCVRENT
jgi:dTDP-4-dehydrorhamnose reductase